MIKTETLIRLLKAFPGSYINHLLEFIADPNTNQYFLMENCETDLDIKCKVLERLSRAAYKTAPYNSKIRNNEFHRFMLRGINEFLGADFSEEDMEAIYTYLGNECNRKKTIRFIESGGDMTILEEAIS